MPRRAELDESVVLLRLTRLVAKYIYDVLRPAARERRRKRKESSFLRPNPKFGQNGLNKNPETWAFLDQRTLCTSGGSLLVVKFPSITAELNAIQ